ncbi:MAG: DUF4215 domain-containing protein [Candidatus Gracilibacteria bacterium]|nr:DUF4215 domain-containing protein [Candidatus Gracilibacteria bacterium]
MALLISALFVSDVLAQPTSSKINIQIKTAVPVLSWTALSSDSLQVTWHWDFVSIGYVPPPVSVVEVELSSDGINYGALQSYLPSDFNGTFSGLAPGTYFARVTIVDGNDFDYVVGPQTLTVGGGGNPPGGGGPGPTPTTNVVLEGLAYPTQQSGVIFTLDGNFVANLDPDDDGVFQYPSTSLPSGVHTFSFTAEDPNGVLSAPLSFDYDITTGAQQTISNLNLAPTTVMSASTATLGEVVVFSGYGYKRGAVTVNVNGPSSSAYLVQTDNLGSWTLDIDTSGFSAGDYDVFAYAVNEQGTLVSPDSLTTVLQILPAAGAPPVCGNGVVELPEECDDGGRFPGDGCDFFCQVEFGASGGICGDGTVDVGEFCDDGNTVAGDGCSAACVVEVVVAACGDGNLDGSEECDDGDTLPGDGCDENCVLESICGNGVREGIEACDDGNTLSGDGCNGVCVLETLCGNGSLNPGEACDDGNTTSFDGCSLSCVVESLPVTGISEVVAGDSATLQYNVVSVPNGPVASAQLYYSLDGATIQLYSEAFVGDTLLMTGLSDGEYRVHSVATDTAGYVEEIVLGVPDAIFTINMTDDFALKAWPEKRLPATGNWEHDGKLSLYETGSTNLVKTWDVVMNDGGQNRQTIDDVALGPYKALYKGMAHLSRRLDVVDFTNLDDLMVDFTEGGAQYLLGGDAHVSQDDYVNGLDISALVTQLYGPDRIADLNADGMVNSLDMSMMLVNLYRSGEGVEE